MKYIGGFYGWNTQWFHVVLYRVNDATFQKHSWWPIVFVAMSIIVNINRKNIKTKSQQDEKYPFQVVKTKHLMQNHKKLFIKQMVSKGSHESKIVKGVSKEWKVILVTT